MCISVKLNFSLEMLWVKDQCANRLVFSFTIKHACLEYKHDKAGGNAVTVMNKSTGCSKAL